MWKKFAGGVAALAVVSFAMGASAATIQGAGGTFPQLVYQKWAQDYKGASGNQVNYQGIGSGAGIRAILAKTVDFGASDKFMRADELSANGFVQFPTVIGGITPIVNLPGVAAGQLKLSGPVLADIFRGAIKKWDDPKITAMNAGVKIPNLPITVVHRSDSSGTSFIFTSYLAAIAPSWMSQVGAGADAPNWPTGLGGKGNDGVAAFVKGTPGAIGYVEFAYAKQGNLTFTQLQAQNGSFVAPSAAAFSAAAAGTNWNVPGYAVLILNQPGANAWPITATTFILVPKKAADANTANEVLKFFDWAYKSGDADDRSLDFVPLPDNVKAMVRKTWATVTGPDGKSVFK